MALKTAQMIANVWTKPLKRILFPPGRSATKVRFGAFRGLLLELDYSCQTQVVFGLAEREVMGYLQKLCRDVKTAMDVGVAEGEYAIYFLLKTTAAKVYAVEPSSVAWESIPKNLQLNGLVEDCRFVEVKRFAGAVRDDRTVLIDDLLQDAEGPIFIKVDVDGGEVDVLNGARAVAQRSDVRWLIETHSADLERDVCRILAGMGYRTVIVRNAWWRWFLPECRGVDHNRWCVAWRQER